MSEKKKVIAAVIAGVNTYMESKKQDYVLSTLKEMRSAFTPNLWGVYGRQEMMQGKRIWQMRWFKK